VLLMEQLRLQLSLLQLSPAAILLLLRLLPSEGMQDRLPSSSTSTCVVWVGGGVEGGGGGVWVDQPA
jgi:hypothetical protein